MIYILVLVLIFFALPFIGRLITRLISWYLRRKLAAHTRTIFGEGFDPFSQGAAERHSSPPPHNRQEPSRHRRSGKRIDPSVGEYVDFEEVSVTESDTQSDTSTSSSDSYYTESQISDVEWEDIK